VPTYSYACTECGDRFDAAQAFSDDALTECTKCNGRLRKLFGSVGVVFKGSGFYRNDSRDAGKKSAGSTTAAKSEGGSGESPSKSDPGTSSSSTAAASSSSPAPAGAAS